MLGFSSRFEFSLRKARQFVLESEFMSSYTSKTAINTTCLSLGTRFSTYDRCICREAWRGDSCNIPDALYYSYSMKTKGRRSLKLRSGTARRVIYATMFNHEFEMIEALLNEHYELVDVFIFVESTFTAFGTRKPLRLLPRLHRGYLKEFAPKIMYLYLDHFPTGARKKGFIADRYLRGYLGIKGLPNIHKLRDDDLFLVFDIDEIPTQEFVAFLKFHDGYPEPFGVRLRWSVFGFFWKNDRPTQVTVGCTVGMLKTVYNNDSNIIRAIYYGLDSKLVPNLKSYKKSHLVQSWFMGEDRYLAGWHCSSCFKPEGIRIKFMSAQNADYPRWGSIPEKMDLKNIISLVREGKWFDGGKIPEADINSDSFYAPQHMLENTDRYRYILINPYVNGGRQS